MKVHAW